MCDYSLCGLPSRLAVEGEELVVHRFRSGSMGLTSPLELSPAKPSQVLVPQKRFWERIKSFFDGSGSPSPIVVCVPPGAQLILKSIPEDLQRQWHVGEEECAFFVNTDGGVDCYRDAVRFRVGPPILLQALREGMRVRVLSLGNEYGDSFREPELAAPAW